MKRKIVLNRILILLIALSMMMVSQNSFVMAEDFKVSQEKYVVDEDDDGEGSQKDIDIQNVLLEENKIITSYDLEQCGIGKELSELSDNEFDSYLNKLETSLNNSNKVSSNKKSFVLESKKIINYDYPAITKKGRTFRLVYRGYTGNQDLTAKVIGNNRFTNILTPGCTSCCIWHWWKWEPKESGVFNIVVYNKKGNPICKRKVYVNTSNDVYLQFEDLKVSTDEASIEPKIENINEFTGYNNSKTEMTFCIGEPNYWRRTLKNDVSINDLKNNKYAMNYLNHEYSEEYYNQNYSKSKFEFKNGNYEVGAFLKNKNSIEWEDAKFINYQKSHIDGLKLKVEKVSQDCEKEKNNNAVGAMEYDVNSTLKFTIDDSKLSNKENLEYAFLLWNEKGMKILKEYGCEKEFSEKFTRAGNYKIYARIRNNKDGYKYNSYEAQVHKEIKIGKNSENIRINNMMIVPDLVSNQSINWDITFHNMYFIKIFAQDLSNGCCCDNNLMYKIYVAHDGYCYALNEYSSDSIIRFFPKSYGKYKIIVLVKDKNSGSEDARKEYTITVKK